MSHNRTGKEEAAAALENAKWVFEHVMHLSNPVTEMKRVIEKLITVKKAYPEYETEVVTKRLARAHYMMGMYYMKKPTPNYQKARNEFQKVVDLNLGNRKIQELIDKCDVENSKQRPKGFTKQPLGKNLVKPIPQRPAAQTAPTEKPEPVEKSYQSLNSSPRFYRQPLWSKSTNNTTATKASFNSRPLKQPKRGR